MYRSGDTVKKSGTYNMLDENGQVINTIEVYKGDRFPPCPYESCTFELNENQKYNNKCKDSHCRDY